ncbi:MAG: L-aspartate oxidase [Deltaproteobacteria bacterium]|nr:L-aspartate oxidase [Deltaproteobacteria bacterium]
MVGQSKILSDFLVIGSGIAGLSFALGAAGTGTVTVLTKKDRKESATNYAQGGIAAVTSEEDSFDVHIGDTLSAGVGLCHEDAVRLMVTRGPDAIERLLEWGVGFTPLSGPGGGWDLGKEGGHTKRRILHALDQTGIEIERALVAAVTAHPRIQVLEYLIAIDLITSAKLGRAGEDRCLGVYALDPARDEVVTVLARATLLATGGAGKVYLYTSNPDISTGDGIAMAYRAGAVVSNMEFIQFHPTCLYHPQAKNFLISEAVRGEGGVLKRVDGTAFMKDVHPMADLAPRDIVARAIDRELKATGDDHVLIDVSHRGEEFVAKRFPGIRQRVLEFGYDIARGPIPVVPAAHYVCGGVRVDLGGETSLRGLLACGETACTGVHGANRLASNSLLEAVVFADEAVRRAAQRLPDLPAPPEDVPDWVPAPAVAEHEAVVVAQNWDEIRRFMWNYVGIVRSDKRLARALHRIELLQEEINEYYWNASVTQNIVELRNIATVAELIIRCAMDRKESRGLHYTLDSPERDDAGGLHDTLIVLDPDSRKPLLTEGPLTSGPLPRR